MGRTVRRPVRGPTVRRRLRDRLNAQRWRSARERASLSVREGLSVEHREVLEQVYLLGSTVAEAAKALGIPPGTVKSRSFYALRALRELRTPSAAGTERSAS